MAVFWRLIPLNSYEFLIVPQCPPGEKSFKNADGVYKYNSMTKKWTKIMDYPEGFASVTHFCCIDATSNIIYGMSSSELFQIDLTKKTIGILGDIQIGRFPGIVLINGAIHVIGGAVNKQHLIYNEAQTKFEMLRGFNHRIHVIPTYLKTRKSVMAVSFKDNSIMEFRKNEWNYFNFSNGIRFHVLNATMTITQDMIIIIGKGGNNKTEEIKTNVFVYNIKAGTLKKSNMPSPISKGGAAMATTRNEDKDDLLTFGFIHKWQKFYKTQPMPFYLIQLVGNWVCYETIHVIEVMGSGDNSHWTLDIDEIIKSTL